MFAYREEFETTFDRKEKNSWIGRDFGPICAFVMGRVMALHQKTWKGRERKRTHLGMSLRPPSGDPVTHSQVFQGPVSFLADIFLGQMVSPSKNWPEVTSSDKLLSNPHCRIVLNYPRVNCEKN